MSGSLASLARCRDGERTTEEQRAGQRAHGGDLRPRPPPPLPIPPPPPEGVPSARYVFLQSDPGWQPPWHPKQSMHPPGSPGSHSTSLKIDKAVTLGKLNILAF